MDSHTKPFSYQSVKSVIQHMNPIKRFQSAAFLPSIRKIHKLIPLTIDQLTLNDRGFTIDGSQYTCGTILEIQRGRATYDILMAMEAMKIGRINRSGGIDYDVDQLGNEISDRTLMPGDIFIANHDKRPYGINIHPEDDYHYSTYVQLTHETCSKNPKRSVPFENGMKLREAVRKLNYYYFGGKIIHHVNRLEIGSSCGILNLPEGMKFKIEELEINNNGSSGLNAICSILDESSFPLQELSIEVEDPNDSIFENERLKTSKSLSLRNTGPYFWDHLLVSLTNTEIHLCGRAVPPKDLIALARHWLCNSREIGSNLSMQYELKSQYFNAFKNQLNASKALIKLDFVFVNGFSIQMNSTSELNLYESNHKLQKCVPRKIVMEVMKLGSAQLVIR